MQRMLSVVPSAKFFTRPYASQLTEEHAGVRDDEQRSSTNPVNYERSAHGNTEVIDLNDDGRSGSLYLEALDPPVVLH